MLCFFKQITKTLDRSLYANVCLIILIFLSATAILLEVGTWQYTKTYSGPFSTAFERPEVLTQHIATSRISHALFNVSGDTVSDPTASALTLRIGEMEIDRPHALHNNIGKTDKPSFSHWGKTVMFSLPNNMSNVSTTHITISLPLRLKSWITVILLLTTGILAYRLHHHQISDNCIMLLFRMPVWLLLAFGYVGAGLSIIFFLTSIMGILQGVALPTTAIIKWSSLAASGGYLEPNVPFVILALCVLGSLAAWCSEAWSKGKWQFKRDELRLNRFFRRWGFWLILSIFVYSVSVQWSGLLRHGDLAWASLVGLMPFTDAAGHFANATDAPRLGGWTEFASRRPMAAAFRTSIVFLADYSYPIMVLIQATLLAAATFLAATSVAHWRGIWAALAFSAIMILTVRIYVPTSLTEPLGLYWALLAVPFFIESMRRNSRLNALLALGVMTIALMTRMGAMFAIPALAFWIIWHFGGNLRERLRTAVFVVIVLVGAGSVTMTLQRFYAASQTTVGGNFAYALCGISIGQIWSSCPDRYASEIAALPNEAAVVALLYAKARENILKDPLTTIIRIYDGASAFTSNIPKILLQGYMFTPTPVLFPRDLFLRFSLFATCIVLVMRRSQGEILFWLLLSTSTVASAGFVYFDDGPRVLSASYPLFGVLLTMGLTGRRSMIAAPSGREKPVPRFAFALVATTLACCFFLPAIAVWIGSSDPQINVAPTPGQHIVYGGHRMSGVLVVADGAPKEADVPTVTLSEFEKIVRHSNIEIYQGLLTPKAPSTPFGVVAGQRAEKGAESGRLYIVPEEVIRSKSVSLWQFTIANWQLKSEMNFYWYFVIHANAVKL